MHYNQKENLLEFIHLDTCGKQSWAVLIIALILHLFQSGTLIMMECKASAIGVQSVLVDGRNHLLNNSKVIPPCVAKELTSISIDIMKIPTLKIHNKYNTIIKIN